MNLDSLATESIREKADRAVKDRKFGEEVLDFVRDQIKQFNHIYGKASE
jgi:hypothetical protein